jgi:hypothetical protein
VHLAETEYELNSIREKHGLTPTAYLERLGFWGGDTWAAHCIWLEDADIDILRRYGAGVAHNPKCNMKIADGAAPIARMLQKGLDVGLGIDSCAVSDNTDFFETMRTAVFLQRLVNKDATAILGRDALWMATLGGARAMKKDKEIGSLEPGKYADLMLIDLKRSATRPYNDLINNIVFAANSSSIRLVMVEGEILVRDGRMTQLDEYSALDEAEEYAYRTFSDAGLSYPVISRSIAFRPTISEQQSSKGGEPYENRSVDGPAGYRDSAARNSAARPRPGTAQGGGRRYLRYGYRGVQGHQPKGWTIRIRFGWGMSFPAWSTRWARALRRSKSATAWYRTGASPCGRCSQCRQGHVNACTKRRLYVRRLHGIQHYGVNSLTKIPDNLGFEQAAFTEPASCCL